MRAYWCVTLHPSRAALAGVDLRDSVTAAANGKLPPITRASLIPTA